MIKENKAIKLIKFIKDNYCDDEESSFCDGLLYYRDYNNLGELRNEIVPYLNEMLSNAKKNSHRAAIIETIATITSDESFDASNNTKIIDEYIFLLSQKATTNYKAARCLSDFICLGADEDEICNKVVKYLNPKDAIEVLVKMSRESYWNEVPSVPKEFSKKLNITEKISYRAGVISTFISIVHPLCLKYGDIGKISFGYPYVEAAVLDWAWKEPGRARHLAEKGILTMKETEILERFGHLLDKDFKDIKLDSDKIRELYYEFFDNRNPLDVMFTLP